MLALSSHNRLAQEDTRIITASEKLQEGLRINLLRIDNERVSSGVLVFLMSRSCCRPIRHAFCASINNTPFAPTRILRPRTLSNPQALVFDSLANLVPSARTGILWPACRNESNLEDPRPRKWDETVAIEARDRDRARAQERGREETSERQRTTSCRRGIAHPSPFGEGGRGTGLFEIQITLYDIPGRAALQRSKDEGERNSHDCRGGARAKD